MGLGASLAVRPADRRSSVSIDGIPKLTVCVVTFNHGAFITDCLRSLVDQEVSFPFEILVADDCSTDSTGQIVADFADLFPEKIRVLPREKNLGVTQNHIDLHNAARGEYVAHLDGDDLALPGKLARQVAFLDQNPNIAICGHTMGVIRQDSKHTGRYFPLRLKKKFGLGRHIRCGMPFLHSSSMYRRTCRKMTSANFELLDWYVFADILKYGDAGYLNIQLGLYRLHENSITMVLKMEGMRNLMLESYDRLHREITKYKSDFFAAMFFYWVYFIVKHKKISRLHGNLLRETFSIQGLFKSIDTFVWHWQNGPARRR